MSTPIRIALGVPNDSKPIPVSVASNKQRKQIDVTAPINAEKVPKYEGPYSVTPTESEQTLETDGKRMEDNVSVGAIPSDYVGSEVQRKSSEDLTASGPTVTAPAGYYSDNVSKSVQSGSVSVPYTGKQVIPSISVSDTTGSIYATVDASFDIVPTVNEGYVTSGTQGKVRILGVGVKDLSTQAAQTITPTTTDQTIDSGKYLTGVQTIKGDANLVASNIKKDVQIFGVTGSYEGSGGGASVNLYQFHFSGFGMDFGDVYSTEDLDDYNLLPSDFAPTNGKYIFAWVDGLPSTGTTIHYADANYDDEYYITGIIYRISSFNDGSNYYDHGGGKYDDQFDINCSFFAHDSMYNYVVSGNLYFGLYMPGRSNNKITAASGDLVDMVNNRNMFYADATVNYTLNIMIVDTN